MRQAAQDAEFAAQAFFEIGFAVGGVGAEQLEGDLARMEKIVGGMDFTGAAPPEKSLETETIEEHRRLARDGPGWKHAKSAWQWWTTSACLGALLEFVCRQ
jgi:hypothetical protein